MGTIHRLSIVGRVPVMIIEDHCIRSRQINPEATRTRAEQENKYIWP